MRTLAGLLLLVLLGFGVPLALGELGARLYFALRPQPYPLNEWAYLAERPPPYADADYFSQELVRESMHGLPRLGTFRGKYINVVGGFRTTTDRPERYDHIVLVLGGSTVFSRRVPDAETIPSHLQRLLEARQPLSYAVVNFGTPGAPVKHQLKRLRETPVRPGDIVIFYDGINDVFNPIYLRGLGRKAGVVQKLNLVERQVHDLRLGVGANSAFLRLLFDRSGGRDGGAAPPSSPVLPDGIKSVAEIHQIQADAANRYERALVVANGYVTIRGGSFYHFLQPNLYIQDVRSPHEERVMRNERALFPGFENVVRLGYPKLREAIALAREKGVVSFDLTHVIEERSWEGEVYFDRAHVNHRANGLLARHMFEAIFE